MEEGIKSLLDSLSRKARRKLYKACYEAEKECQKQKLENGEIDRLCIDTELSLKLTPPDKDTPLTLQTINNYNKGETVPSGEILYQAISLLDFWKVQQIFLDQMSDTLQLLFRLAVKYSWTDPWLEFHGFKFRNSVKAPEEDSLKPEGSPFFSLTVMGSRPQYIFEIPKSFLREMEGGTGIERLMSNQEQNEREQFIDATHKK